MKEEQNNLKTNNQNNCDNDLKQNENNKDKLTNKKSSTFLIGVICAVVVLFEILANEIFKFSFETNTIIQVVSIALAILVWLGVIKHEGEDEKTDISSIKNEISSQIEDTIKSIKNKNKDK